MGKKLFKKVSICVLVALCSVCAVMGVTSTKKQSPTVNAQTWTQSDIKYFGYDISIHQGAVNFTTMKRYADFVICRIGYGTSLDSNFKTYMTNAKAAGLHVGCSYSLWQPPLLRLKTKPLGLLTNLQVWALTTGI